MKKLDFAETIQWVGAPLMVGGHLLNAIGPSVYPWNVVSFFLGTCCFLAWSYTVKNKPQLLINLVTFCLGSAGIYKAFFG